MRILTVHNRYRSSSPSGENRVVDEEHRALSAAGHEVVRFERSSDEIASFRLGRRALVPVDAVWSRETSTGLFRSLVDVRPDVVHVHNVVPLLSPSVFAACARARVPCVVTLHNFQLICPSGFLFRTGVPCSECVGRKVPLPAVLHGCYRASRAATTPIALSAAVNRHAWRSIPSAYLFLSHAQKRALSAARLPEWRCFVKPNMVEEPWPDRGADCRTGSPLRGPLIVYAGRLVEAKGVRTLLRAWDRYRSFDGPAGVTRGDASLRLAIAGAGPLEGEVRAWAQGREDVEVLGVLSPDACMRLFKEAAAAAVPSEWQEPFGLVVAEAMAAGTPPLASAQGALPDLISDGVDGFLFPPGDADALAALLWRVQAMPAWISEMGAAARRTYESTFAPAVVLSQLESVYRFAVRHPSWLDSGGAPLERVDGLTGRETGIRDGRLVATSREAKGSEL